MLNPSEAVSRTRGNIYTGQIGKHHVSPEVVEVENKAYQDDQTKHKHVLRSPTNLRTTVCNSITLIAASTSVLRCQDESIDDVTHSKECKSTCTQYCVPVAT